MSQNPATDPSKPLRMTLVSLPPVLLEFCWLVLAFSVFTTVYCLLMHFALHRIYPYDWPFFDPVVRFSDFTIYQNKFHLFHTAAFFHTDFPFTYPAPMAVLYEAFFKAGGHHALSLYLSFIVLVFAVPALWFARALVSRGLRISAVIALVAVTFLLSWPGLLMLDRANVEAFVWLTTVLGTWAYARGKEWSAAALFGVAAALKLFPFVLLVLMLTRRKFPKLLFGAVVFLAVTVVSLAVLGPTIPVAYAGINDGLKYFHDSYLIRYLGNETGLDHSIMAFIKVPIAAALRKHSIHALTILTSIYMPLMAILGILLYFLRIRHLPWMNQLMTLSIAAIYFTPFSGDGTLVHLYPAFALCCFVSVDAWRRRLEVPGLRMMFFCFAYLFSAQGFILVGGFRFEGQAKCIAMGILLFNALRYPLGPAPDDAPHNLTWPDASQIANVRPSEQTA